MKKTIYEFIFALFFSIIGFFILIGFHDLSVILEIKRESGQIVRVGLWGFLMGLPIGSTFGIALFDKLYCGTNSANLYSIICALILSILGCFIGLELHSYFKLGQWSWIVLPLLNATLGVCGYKFALLFIKMKPKKNNKFLMFFPRYQVVLGNAIMAQAWLGQTECSWHFRKLSRIRKSDSCTP